MSQPEKPTKRIVSKAEYVALRSKRASLSVSSTVFLITTWVGMVCGVFFCLVLLLAGIMSLPIYPLMGALGIALVIALGYGIIRVGMFFSDQAVDMMQKAEDMDMGVPFTQANAGDLPASESLVRGSSEPVQEQESVLLRPSLHNQQTPAEQLLRPMGE